MKKNIFILFIVSILFTVTISAMTVSAAENLIPNGDFEGTDISQWIPVGSSPSRITTEKHAGSASMKAGARSMWYFSPQIHVNLVKDVTYVLTAWVKNSGTAARTYEIVIAVPKSANAEDDLVSGNADYIQTIADSEGNPTPVSVAAGVWKELKVNFKAPKTIMCNFFVQMSDETTTEDFYVDDVSIVALAASSSSTASSSIASQASSAASSSAAVSSTASSAAESTDTSSVAESSESIIDSSTTDSSDDTSNTSSEEISNDNSSETSSDEEITEGGNNTILIVLIAVAAAALVGGLIYYLIRRKA